MPEKAAAAAAAAARAGVEGEERKAGAQQTTVATLATSRFKMTMGMFSSAGSRASTNVSGKSGMPAASTSTAAGTNGSGSGSGAAASSGGASKFSSYAGRARSFLGKFCNGLPLNLP